MNPTILQTLFLDNPELSSRVQRFCETLPEYAQAEQDLRSATQELEQTLGYEAYCRLEDTAIQYLGVIEKACYLFGLGIRREVLQAIQP